ncbi:hypothetical protein K438DRAFT_1773255 [Mycena galopus ATCC 62051]|nr:hypothetical protein K438DRAFT_1773255 [Mycena galopus ATCC 62051]
MPCPLTSTTAALRELYLLLLEILRAQHERNPSEDTTAWLPLLFSSNPAPPNQQRYYERHNNYGSLSPHPLGQTLQPRIIDYHEGLSDSPMTQQQGHSDIDCPSDTTVILASPGTWGISPEGDHDADTLLSINITFMPTISERQSLIRELTCQAEQDADDYFEEQRLNELEDDMEFDRRMTTINSGSDSDISDMTEVKRSWATKLEHQVGVQARFDIQLGPQLGFCPNLISKLDLELGLELGPKLGFSLAPDRPPIGPETGSLKTEFTTRSHDLIQLRAKNPNPKRTEFTISGTRHEKLRRQREKPLTVVLFRLNAASRRECRFGIANNELVSILLCHRCRLLPLDFLESSFG